jgi:SPP1 family predicted phage head-tail adaptor
MPINAGDMDQRITLRRRATGKDALGQRSTTWETVDEVWAQAQPLRGREFVAANAEGAAAEVRFRIYWRSDITSAWAVIWRGVTYALVAPPIDPRGAMEVLELMCASGVRDALP